MGSIGTIAHWPAVWGVLGAFAYAGPRLLPCLTSAHDGGRKPWACVGEFVICLIIGGIGAGAFSALAINLTHVKDVNAVAAFIGLLANPCVPRVTGAAPALLSAMLESPLAKALKGDNK